MVDIYEAMNIHSYKTKHGRLVVKSRFAGGHVLRNFEHALAPPSTQGIKALIEKYRCTEEASIQLDATLLPGNPEIEVLVGNRNHRWSAIKVRGTNKVADLKNKTKDIGGLTNEKIYKAQEVEESLESPWAERICRRLDQSINVQMDFAGARELAYFKECNHKKQHSVQEEGNKLPLFLIRRGCAKMTETVSPRDKTLPGSFS
ncbi:unnamed protein product [Dovyalis caffra]|uniref:Uncharacterized protein n=1 Tax=Dovyalis caffra TaxID=77055 RepID=A0AAV1RHF9_9ROSI|nr:unnamed protein product [Dovyalis caffra]